MSSLLQSMGSRRVIGTFLKLPGLMAVSIAREHFDFVVVDREHSPLSESEALEIVGHGAALGLPTLLRLPSFDSGQINRALEVGAAGIQLSMVDHPETVRNLRAACEYAPRGRRSVSLAHPVARYGASGLSEYIESSRGGPLVVVQLESVMDPERYQEILAEKPDVAFIGVTDLTVDCGFDDAALRDSIDAIAAAARATDTVLGAFGLQEREQVRYLIASGDMSMLRQGMVDVRRALEDDETLEETK